MIVRHIADKIEVLINYVINSYGNDTKTTNLLFIEVCGFLFSLLSTAFVFFIL